MISTRFLQIHTLHSYTAALLNRDDSGLAKRLPYGDAIRTRISSQCLKRHWRKAEDDPHALKLIDGAELSYRSRELITKKVIEPLRGRYADEIIASLEPEFQKAIYGEKADKGKQSRQTLLLGEPELRWLAEQCDTLASASPSAKDAKEKASAWAKEFKSNIKAMRDSTKLPGGLAAALFGRMVTSDSEANIDAPIYVAHSFTVHEAQVESDYFTAVDDLKADDDSGADTIQETELTSGIFYGYVVIDLPGLIANCGGDCELAGCVVHNLVYLIAEVSPGAKLGSTAPFGRADFLMIEAGDRQPRSLAAAFRNSLRPDAEEGVTALAAHLKKLDDSYQTGEQRRYLAITNAGPATGEKLALPELAKWAQARVGEAQ